MKKGVFLLLFCLSLLALVHAESPLEGTVDDYTAFAENISAARTSYLGEAWKEVLFKNPAVMRLNSLFMSIDTLILVLFARHYSFSLEMLFAFILWLFTLLSVRKYLLFSNPWYNFLTSLGIVIILAHLQIFNYVAAALVKLVFYRTSTGWTIAGLLIVGLLFLIYFYLNSIIARTIKKAREKEERSDLKSKVGAQEEFMEGIKKGSS